MFEFDTAASAGELLTIQQVAELYPGTAGRNKMHRNSVFRWIREGVCGVKLKTVSRGGRRFVRLADLEAFHHEIAERKSHGERMAARDADTKAAQKEFEKLIS